MLASWTIPQTLSCGQLIFLPHFCVPRDWGCSSYHETLCAMCFEQSDFCPEVFHLDGLWATGEGVCLGWRRRYLDCRRSCLSIWAFDLEDSCGLCRLYNKVSEQRCHSPSVHQLIHRLPSSLGQSSLEETHWTREPSESQPQCPQSQPGCMCG